MVFSREESKLWVRWSFKSPAWSVPARWVSETTGASASSTRSFGPEASFWGSGSWNSAAFGIGWLVALLDTSPDILDSVHGTRLWPTNKSGVFCLGVETLAVGHQVCLAGRDSAKIAVDCFTLLNLWGIVDNPSLKMCNSATFRAVEAAVGYNDDRVRSVKLGQIQ